MFMPLSLAPALTSASVRKHRWAMRSLVLGSALGLAVLGSSPAWAFNRPAFPPEPDSSDTALVSKTIYAPDGRVYEVTDNAGMVSRTEHDAAGRVIAVIENVVDGNPETGPADEDRTTRYAYNASGQVIEQTADLNDFAPGSGGDQVTHYVYSGELDAGAKGSPVPNNSLLRATVYPDALEDGETRAGVIAKLNAGQGGDFTEITYLADGSPATRTDPRGVELAYAYDDGGRRIEQRVTAGSTPGDQHAAYAYTALGQLLSLTTYDTAAANPGTETSELTWTYNGFQQPLSETQDHKPAGGYASGIPTVSWSYETTTSGGAYTLGSRLVATTYPNGRKVHTLYDTPESGSSAIDSALSRANGLAIDSFANPGDIGETLVAYTRLGDGRTVVKDFPELNARLDHRTLDASGQPLVSGFDPHDGFDRFGRIAGMRWDRYDGDAPGQPSLEDPYFHVRYGHDRAGSRTHAERRVYTGQSQAYTHDALHRLKSYEVGLLQDIEENPLPGAPAPTVLPLTRYLDTAWNLDALGNPLSLRRNQSDDFYKEGQFSRANEILSREVASTRSGSPLGDSFDNAGNTSSSWETISGNLSVNGGKLNVTQANPAAIFLIGGEVGPHSSDVRITLPSTITTPIRVGEVFGYQDPQNHWIVNYYRDPTASSGQIQVCQVLNGVLTVVRSQNATVNAGATLPLLTGSLQRFVNLHGMTHAFPNGFPSGRVGLYSNTTGVSFDHAKIYPNDQSRPLAGRWERFSPNNTPDDGLLFTNQAHYRHRPTLLVGPRVGASGQPFRATFSLTRSGASRNHDGLEFLFGVQDEGTLNRIRIDHKSGSAVAPVSSRLDDGQTTSIAGVATASSMPAPALAGDRLWVRVTSDGTEVSVRATVANTAAPGEGVWNQTPVAHRSSNFPLVGGRVGFRTVYGIAKVHQFTLETDPDDNGTWTTEYAGTFDHPSGHATVTYDHDDAGNLTFDGVYRYGYDAWNRLVEVRNAYREQTGSQNVREGSVVTAMAYDGLGRRIVKTVSNSGDLDATLYSLYDAQREIEERNGPNLVLRQQVWGLDYIDELVVVSTNLNPQSGSSSQDPDPQQCDVDHYAVLDAQFNVLGLIGVELEQAIALANGGSFSGSPYETVRQTTAQNPQGSWPIVVVERYEYTPYGQRQVYRGSKNDRKAYAPYLASARLGSLGHSLNPFGHQGLKHDEGIGLVYNRARNRILGLDRWMTRDPLGLMFGSSLYLLLDAKPNRYGDDTGLHPNLMMVTPSSLEQFPFHHDGSFLHHYQYGGGDTYTLSMEQVTTMMSDPSTRAAADEAKRAAERGLEFHSWRTVDCENRTHSWSFSMKFPRSSSIFRSHTQFVMGDGSVVVSGPCLVQVEGCKCNPETGSEEPSGWSGRCNLTVSFNDKFRDPLDSGIEVGTPFDIEGSFLILLGRRGSFE